MFLLVKVIFDLPTDCLGSGEIAQSVKARSSQPEEQKAYFIILFL